MFLKCILFNVQIPTYDKNRQITSDDKLNYM